MICGGRSAVEDAPGDEKVFGVGDERCEFDVPRALVLFGVILTPPPIAVKSK